MADQLVAQMQALHFNAAQSIHGIWQPAVNIYAHGDGLHVCVDLAGVRKRDIKIEVEPRRLVIRGHRQPPDSGLAHGPCPRILVMEIPDGSFQRVLEFPLPVDAGRVTAKQDDGWLWITLPVIHTEVEP